MKYKADMGPREPDFTDIVLSLNEPPLDLVISDVKVTIGIHDNLWKIRIATALLRDGKVEVPELYVEYARTLPVPVSR